MADQIQPPKADALLAALDAAHYYIDATDRELADDGISRDDALLRARESRELAMKPCTRADHVSAGDVALVVDAIGKALYDTWNLRAYTKVSWERFNPEAKRQWLRRAETVYRAAIAAMSAKTGEPTSLTECICNKCGIRHGGQRNADAGF